MRVVGLLLLWGSPAIAGTLYTVDPSSDTLLELDTTRLRTRVVGAIGVDFDFGALAWDAANQRMFLSPGRSIDMLFTVDVASGSLTRVGAHGIGDLFGMAYDPVADVLWGGSGPGTNLYQIDPNTGRSRQIGQLQQRISGAEWDPFFGGMVYNNLATTEFYLVRPPDTTAYLLGNAGVYMNDGGIAYDADTELYFSVDWNGTIQSFDPKRGFELVSTTAGPMALDGLASTQRFDWRGPRLVNSSGVCPGQMTFDLTDLTPNADYAVVRGDPGSMELRNGACRGSFVQLSGASLVTRRSAAANGTAIFQGNVPGAACGSTIQVLDLSACRASNLVQLQ